MIGKIIILRFIVNLSTLPTLFGLKEFFRLSAVCEGSSNANILHVFDLAIFILPDKKIF